MFSSYWDNIVTRAKQARKRAPCGLSNLRPAAHLCPFAKYVQLMSTQRMGEFPGIDEGFCLQCCSGN